MTYMYSIYSIALYYNINFNCIITGLDLFLTPKLTFHFILLPCCGFAKAHQTKLECTISYYLL